MAWTLTSLGGQYKNSPFYMEFLVDSVEDLATECTQYGIPAPGSLATIPGVNTYIKNSSGTWVALPENTNLADQTFNNKLASKTSAEVYGDSDLDLPTTDPYKAFLVNNNLLDTSIVKDIGAIVEPNSTKYYTSIDDAITDVVAGTYTHATSTSEGAICSIHVSGNIKCIKLLANCVWSAITSPTSNLSCIFDFNGYRLIQDFSSTVNVTNSNDHIIFYGVKENSEYGYGASSTGYITFRNGILFCAIGLKKFRHNANARAIFHVYFFREVILKDLESIYESEESNELSPLFLSNGSSTANSINNYKFINLKIHRKLNIEGQQGAVFHIKSIRNNIKCRIEFTNCDLLMDNIHKRDDLFYGTQCIRIDRQGVQTFNFSDATRLIINNCNIECTSGPALYTHMRTYCNNSIFVGGKSVICTGTFGSPSSVVDTEKLFFKNCKFIQKNPVNSGYTSAMIFHNANFSTYENNKHYWIYLDNSTIEMSDIGSFIVETDNRLYMSNCTTPELSSVAEGSLAFIGANMDEDMKEDYIDTGNESYSFKLARPTIKVGMTELTEAQLISLLALLN